MPVIPIIFLVFVGAVFLNWKYKMNMGLTCGTAAFIIGCFLLDMAPGDLKDYLPMKVIFSVTSITMFYGFALENGTLLTLVNRVLHSQRKRPGTMPVLVFLLCIGLGIAGLDAGAIVAVMAPVAMTAASLTKQDPLPVSCAVLFGAPAGSNYVFGHGGSIIRGLLEESCSADNALAYGTASFWDGCIFFSLFFLIVFVKVFRGQPSRLQEPEDRGEKPAFDKKQKQTLVLIGAVIVLAAGPALIGELFQNEAAAALGKKMDIGFLTLTAALAASCLKLGDLTQVLRLHVPWKMLLMISGVSMLTGIAVDCGLVEVLSRMLGAGIPSVLIPSVLVTVAGVMSFFCGAISVVIPTLFPLVPSLSAGSAISASLLYSAVVLGASITGMSPFSAGGSLVAGSIVETELRDRQIFRQMFLALAGILLGAIYMLIKNLIA